MRFELIAVDLDGTLFDDEKKILPQTAAVLKRAAQAGAQIMPATGRPLSGVSEEVLRASSAAYAITANGAAVYRIADRKCVFEEPVPAKKGAEILRGLRQFHISADAFADGEAYKENGQKDIVDKLPLSEQMKSFIRSTRKYVDDLPGFILTSGVHLQKITLNFFSDGQGGCVDRQQVLEYLQGIKGISVVSGGDNNLEITLKGVNKGTALLKTAEMLGIDPLKTVAFGDSGNDIDMIKAAGTGVAMGNAEEDIKVAADTVTLSNNDNGIGAFLDKYF